MWILTINIKILGRYWDKVICRFLRAYLKINSQRSDGGVKVINMINEYRNLSN